MTEFWEDNFIDKQEMWGFTPSLSAILTKDLFMNFVRLSRRDPVPAVGITTL